MWWMTLAPQVWDRNSRGVLVVLTASVPWSTPREMWWATPNAVAGIMEGDIAIAPWLKEMRSSSTSWTAFSSSYSDLSSAIPYWGSDLANPSITMSTWTIKEPWRNTNCTPSLSSMTLASKRSLLQSIGHCLVKKSRFFRFFSLLSFFYCKRNKFF